MKPYSLTAYSRWYGVRGIATAVLIFLVFGFAGVIISLLWPQSHRAQATVIAPDSVRVAKINQAADLMYLESEENKQGLSQLARQTSIDSEQAFAEFIAAYTSADTRRNFFLVRELYRLQGYESPVDSLAFRQLVARFSSKFDYQLIQAIGDAAGAQLFFSYHNREGSAELLNAFIDHAAGIAAANLQSRQERRIVHLQETLQVAGSYYQSMEQALRDEKLPETGFVSSANTAYLQPRFELLVDLHHKQLQSWYLSQALSQITVNQDDFKPVRVVSLANAEGSVAIPEKEWVVGGAFGAGFVVALLFVFGHYRNRRVRVISE